jgi:anti-sigma B factor antagonist
MLEIEITEHGTIRLTGRLDASHADSLRDVLDGVSNSCTLDFEHLRYISSAGLGVLFAAQRRLVDSGSGMRIKNMNPHLREVFRIAGFDHVFEIV